MMPSTEPGTNRACSRRASGFSGLCMRLGRRGTHGVCILDAQKPFPAVFSRKEVIKQRRTQATQMQRVGRRGSEAKEHHATKRDLELSQARVTIGFQVTHTALKLC